MEASGEEAALSALRQVVGPQASNDELRELLLKVNGDVDAAALNYVQDKSTPQTTLSVETQALDSLKDLLGEDVEKETMLELLKRSNFDVSAAIDLFFCEKAQAHISIEDSNAATSTEVSTQSPPPPPPAATQAHDPHKFHANEEYEVEITDGDLKWKIGNVLGRIVVQDVTAGGAAHRANIQKADVLIECSGNPVKENNVGPIVTRLSKEVVTVPVKLRFRRADHTNAHEEKKDVPTPPSSEVSMERPVVEKYGIEIFESALDTMRQAASDSEKYSSDLLLQYYVWSEGNVPLAMDQLFQPVPLLPNFSNVVGHEWFSDDGTVNYANPDWPLYDVSFPTGPMGITVENIHERTIVVNVKDGTSAARGNVTVDSWLVAINGECITHLTHRETLHRIHTLPRPLLLSFCVTPGPWLPALKQNMEVNIRHIQSANPSERHELYVSDEDRTSFKRFERKLTWALKCLPSVACNVLLNAAENEAYVVPADLKYTPAEPTGQPCAARQALQAKLRNLNSQVDKGEHDVVGLLRGLTKLSLWSIQLTKTDAEHAEHAWWIFHLVLDVFENGSVMEKSATWDAIVDGLKAVSEALSTPDYVRVLPALIARLSFYSSPSSRIIPLVLLPLAYPRVEGDMAVQLRGLFERLTLDDAPLVRRAAVYSLSELAVAIGSKSIAWAVTSLEKLCSDHSDLVRLYAVKAIAALGPVVAPLDEASLRLVRCQLMPLVNSFVTDSDWQVRHQTVEMIPSLLAVLGSDLTDVLVDHFVELGRDPNMEVRIAAARTAFALCEALNTSIDQHVEDGQERPLHAKVQSSILPAFFSLSRDPTASVRRAVATSLGSAISILGASQANLLETMIKQLIGDKDTMTGQYVVEQLAHASEHLSESLEKLLVSHVEKIAKARQWRLRLLAVESVQKWSRPSVPPTLVVLTLSLLEDSVCQVRLSAVSALVRITELSGSEWLASTGLAPVLNLLDQSFQLQLAGLEALRLLANGHLMAAAQLDLVVDLLIVKATKSKTDSIRVKADAILDTLSESGQVARAKIEEAKASAEEAAPASVESPERVAPEQH
ncbi:unnamed protein product [Aphanomyces euteiches]|nr:hypothetical protein AeRB84_001148 [Aphanomyces euteiches]